MQRLKLSLGDIDLDRRVRKFNAVDASHLIRCYIKWVNSVACYNRKSWLNGEFLDLYLEGPPFGPLLRYQIMIEVSLVESEIGGNLILPNSYILNVYIYFCTSLEAMKHMELKERHKITRKKEGIAIITGTQRRINDYD
jgi:hypothetical protein